MLNVVIRTVLASERDKPAKVVPYKKIRTAEMFLYMNLVHLKGDKWEAINLHTGETYNLIDETLVIKIYEPSITGIMEV